MSAELAVRAFVDGLSAAAAHHVAVRWSLPDATHRQLAAAAASRVGIPVRAESGWYGRYTFARRYAVVLPSCVAPRLRQPVRQAGPRSSVMTSVGLLVSEVAPLPASLPEDAMIMLGGNVTSLTLADDRTRRAIATTRPRSWRRARRARPDGACAR